jgi:hypothetical protein
VQCLSTASTLPLEKSGPRHVPLAALQSHYITCPQYGSAAEVCNWPRASILACLLLRRCWGLSGHDEFSCHAHQRRVWGELCVERPQFDGLRRPFLLLRGKRRLSGVDVERARLLYQYTFTNSVPTPSVLPIFNMPVPPLWRRRMRFTVTLLPHDP